MATSAYARSKAIADDLARSFAERLDVVVVRPTNCYGPWQHPEKAIPRWTSRALRGETLPVWGDGRQVRDWDARRRCGGRHPARPAQGARGEPATSRRPRRPTAPPRPARCCRPRPRPLAQDEQDAVHRIVDVHPVPNLTAVSPDRKRLAPQCPGRPAWDRFLRVLPWAVTVGGSHDDHVQPLGE